MKQLSDQFAMPFLVSPNGLIIPRQHKVKADKVFVKYDSFSFENAQITPVTRNVYLLAKFGNAFQSIEPKVEGYLTCRAVQLPDRSVLTVQPSGQAVVFDADGRPVRELNFSHCDRGPADIFSGKDEIWASFPESNAVISFDDRSLRQKICIKDNTHKVLSAPEGLWGRIEEDKLYICNAGSGKVVCLDIKSFETEEYLSFDQSVHQYMKQNAGEYVLLNSGVYRL